MTHNTDNVIQDLLHLRAAINKPVPSPRLIPELTRSTLETLFPQFSNGSDFSKEELARSLTNVRSLLERLCSPVLSDRVRIDEILNEFEAAMPEFHSLLRSDAEAIYEGDPAAASVEEVLIAYPGFFAIAVYRLAHWLFQRHIPIVPRLLTEYAHQVTGVDIHPGATIGKAFVIDHGTGIVIGETTVIEDHVTIFQGVTLGALCVKKSLANSKRHPTIQRNTIIYANATILGGDTVVGANSIIGGNVWLTSSVPENSRVYHGREVGRSTTL
jgi:serine O-acetyltransferase